MKVFVLVVLCSLVMVDPTRAVHRQTPPSLTTVSEYDLSVKVLPDEHRLEVGGVWKMPPAPAEKERIEFYLSPKMKGLTVHLVEPKASAPLNLVNNKEDGGDTKWVFKPAVPVPAGQSIVLQFSYLSDGKPAPQFNVSPEGSFAGGGGELWYPQAAFKDREVGVLRFKVPVGDTAFSNGLLKSSSQQKASGEFIFHVTQPLKFAFASGKYSVTRREGTVPFNLYMLRPRAQAGVILDGCARALSFLTGLFGRFHYREFSLVEVNFPTVVRGTSEFGAIFADRSKLDNFDLSYWGHELGHQWWGLVVKSAPNTTGQMMLSEGVAQFGSLLAVEVVEGQAAAEEYRRNGYRGKSHSAKSYFELLRAGTDFPLTAYLPKQDETLTMHRVANSKGFILMDMLSRRIGRKRLAAILRRFIEQRGNQPTSWHEFQKAIEASAGQDVHWFFEQWFERTGAPDYHLTWRQQDGYLRGVVSQTAPYFRATLEVEMVGATRRLTKSIEVLNGQKEFRWKAPFKIRAVLLDPHFKVLRWLPEFRSQPVP